MLLQDQDLSFDFISIASKYGIYEPESPLPTGLGLMKNPTEGKPSKRGEG
ncbi:MAG: hypothetical protein ACI9TB_000341 [Parasphingorhabdus sp.]